MAWVETRPGGRRYVVWRARVRGPDGVTRSVRRSRPVGAVGHQEAAQEAETTTRVVERREPRPRHVGPSRALRAFLKDWRDVRRRAPETVRFYSKLLDVDLRVVLVDRLREGLRRGGLDPALLVPVEQDLHLLAEA